MRIGALFYRRPIKLQMLLKTMPGTETGMSAHFVTNGKILAARPPRNADRFHRAVVSVLSGYGNPERSKTALLSAERFLVDAENGVIKLLTPPFTEDSIADIGYIASYPPGIRENGAQYTHAAIWLAKAFFRSAEKIPNLRRREDGCWKC